MFDVSDLLVVGTGDSYAEITLLEATKDRDQPLTIVERMGLDRAIE